MIKQITCIADMESAMNEMQKSDAKVREAYAKFSAEIAERRSELDAQLGTDSTRKIELEGMIQDYVDKNKATIFPAGKKSLELPAGTISIRLGPLSIAMKKGTKLDSVIATAKRLKLKITRTPPEELDKDAVKELISDEVINDATLKELGLVANQSETITIKLNDQ